jgi:hypothetical protein
VQYLCLSERYEAVIINPLTGLAKMNFIRLRNNVLY